jgi:hypothetical protein
MFEYSAHRRMERKKLGGQKEICPTFFPLCPTCQKNFPCKLSKIVVGGDDENMFAMYYNLRTPMILPPNKTHLLFVISN